MLFGFVHKIPINLIRTEGWRGKMGDINSCILRTTLRLSSFLLVNYGFLIALLMLYHSRPRFDCETVIWWMRCDVTWCEVIQVILFVFHCHWCGVAGPSETEGVVHCSVSSSKTELRLDSAGSISSVLHLHQHYHLTSLHALFSLSDISHWIGFNPILSGSLSVGLPLLLLRMILFIPGGWEDVKLCRPGSTEPLSCPYNYT